MTAATPTRTAITIPAVAAAPKPLLPKCCSDRKHQTFLFYAVNILFNYMVRSLFATYCRKQSGHRESNLVHSNYLLFPRFPFCNQQCSFLHKKTLTMLMLLCWNSTHAIFQDNIRITVDTCLDTSIASTYYEK